MHRDLNPAAFIIFAALLLASNIVFIEIQRGVNAALPLDQRYKFFFTTRTSGRNLEILRRYRELYPGDSLPVLYWVLLGLTMVTGVVMVLSNMKGRS